MGVGVGVQTQPYLLRARDLINAFTPWNSYILLQRGQVGVAGGPQKTALQWS